jgi:hypothetical protein
MNNVSGSEVLIYPGMTLNGNYLQLVGSIQAFHCHPHLCVCKKGNQDCDTGTPINLAFPADPNDLLSTNFSKPSFNPIAQVAQSVGPEGGGPPDGGGDPSTAFLVD